MTILLRLSSKFLLCYYSLCWKRYFFLQFKFKLAWSLIDIKWNYMDAFDFSALSTCYYCCPYFFILGLFLPSLVIYFYDSWWLAVIVYLLVLKCWLLGLSWKTNFKCLTGWGRSRRGICIKCRQRRPSL